MSSLTIKDVVYRADCKADVERIRKERNKEGREEIKSRRRETVNLGIVEASFSESASDSTITSRLESICKGKSYFKSWNDREIDRYIEHIQKR